MIQIKDSSIYQKSKTGDDERKSAQCAESERDENDKKEVEATAENAVEVCDSINLQKKHDNPQDDDERKSAQGDESVMKMVRKRLKLQLKMESSLWWNRSEEET